MSRILIHRKCYISDSQIVLFQLRKRSQKLDASIALDGEDHFNTLSDEVVLRVFKLLPRKILVKCSLVSREADP